MLDLTAPELAVLRPAESRRGGPSSYLAVYHRASPLALNSSYGHVADSVRAAWLCGSLLAPFADERWPHPREGDSCSASPGPTRCWPGRGWPFLDRCLPCRQRGAGQRGAPAAKRGRTTLTGDEWRPSSATRWGQIPFTINLYKIVNWGRNSPAGGARTHPRSQQQERCVKLLALRDAVSARGALSGNDRRGRTTLVPRHPHPGCDLTPHAGRRGT